MTQLVMQRLSKMLTVEERKVSKTTEDFQDKVFAFIDFAEAYDSLKHDRTMQLLRRRCEELSWSDHISESFLNFLSR